MSVSGIYAIIDPQRWDAVLQTLARLPGVELHQRDAGAGRLVLTQEAASISAQIAGLERVQAVDGVQVAELVYHYLGDDETNSCQAADTVPLQR